MGSSARGYEMVSGPRRAVTWSIAPRDWDVNASTRCTPRGADVVVARGLVRLAAHLGAHTLAETDFARAASAATLAAEGAAPPGRAAFGVGRAGAFAGRLRAVVGEVTAAM